MSTNNTNNSAEFKKRIYDAKIIMSTFYVDLLGTEINTECLFYLLSIGRIKNPKITQKSEKIKVEHPGIPNLIFSARYMTNFRGIITSLKKKYFKNAVGIYITGREKNVHIRILKSNFGISGSNSVKEVKEVTGYICNRIKKIQNILKHISNSPLTLSTIEWVKKSTKGIKKTIIKGGKYLVFPNETIITKNDKKWIVEGKIEEKVEGRVEKKVEGRVEEKVEGRVEEKVEDRKLIEVDEIYTLKVPKEYSTSLYPVEVDHIIAEFLIDKIFDFYIYRDYCAMISGICTIESIYKNELNKVDVKQSMCYVNFNIGYVVNLGKLYSQSRDNLNPLILIQDDDNTSFVKFQLRYTSTPELDKHIKVNEKRISIHSVQIFRCGRITLSGPHEKLNKIAYFKIMDVMDRVKPFVSIG